jgi:hypothetical protein
MNIARMTGREFENTITNEQNNTKNKQTKQRTHLQKQKKNKQTNKQIVAPHVARVASQRPAVHCTPRHACR